MGKLHRPLGQVRIEEIAATKMRRTTKKETKAVCLNTYKGVQRNKKPKSIPNTKSHAGAADDAGILK